MKKLNLKPQLAIITTIGTVAVLSAIILSQSTIMPMHNAYAKDKSTGNKKDSSQSDSEKADNTNDCSTTSTDNQDNEDNGNRKADNTNDCTTSTDNQDNEENDNGNDKSNDG